MNKTVFLYRERAKLTPDDMQALRDAGFVPIKVKVFEDVMVLDPLHHASRADVWMAAMEAIAKANPNEGAKTLFGRLLAERLSETDIAKVGP